MKRSAAAHRSNRGMTLIEIMVVLVIMGSIAGLIAVNVFGAKRNADQKTALIDIHQLSDAVETYRLKHSSLPESLDNIVPGEIARIRRDPWGNPYVYSQAGDTFQVISYGPDKAAGGGDDISIENAEKS